MFKLLHHGARHGVTGSCHQLFINESQSILVDCGLFQGAEVSARERRNTEIEFPIDTIKSVLLTHCHIDHVGRLPWLIAAGYQGPIFASEATAQLLPLVLEDALKVGVTRRTDLIQAFLSRIQQQLRPVPYDLWSDLYGSPFVKARFRNAGHILGSAYIELDISGERIIFSGDLGAPYTPLLPAPKSPYRADTLILESTYGDKNHTGRKERHRQLKAVVENALKDNGTVLIPAFSIGRTQELLYELEQIIHSCATQLWSELDVIVDSPLAARFTDEYKKLKGLWDREAKNREARGRHPLSFENMLTIDAHSDHERLVNYLKSSGRPAIVIAASGMCSGGRIMNYLKALIEDSRTDILFVGYQSQGTPGRDIQKYGPRGGYVELEGERYDIKAGVHTISGYSAHADQTNLINFVRRIRKQPKEIRLVHGDKDAKLALAKKLEKVYPKMKVMV